MKEIGSASIAYSLVIFLVCLLLVVLYFCECGRNRGEMITVSSGSKDLIVVASTGGCNSKLLTRQEVPWPLRKFSWKEQIKTTVTGNSEIKRQTRSTNYSLEVNDGNESDISQPDKIYTRS